MVARPSLDPLGKPVELLPPLRIVFGEVLGANYQEVDVALHVTVRSRRGTEDGDVDRLAGPALDLSADTLDQLCPQPHETLDNARRDVFAVQSSAVRSWYERGVVMAGGGSPRAVFGVGSMPLT